MNPINGTTFNIQNSITVNVNNTEAVDIFSPLSLLDWIKYTKQAYTDSNLLISNYNQYLKKWYYIKETDLSTQQQYTTNLYISLFKEIAVNYSSVEEQRFIQNIDYTDPKQILAVLPFFVKKIKQICLYFASLRETLKTNNVINNLRGSNIGIEKILCSDIIQALNSTDIQNTLNSLNVSFDNIKQNIAIEIEELYNTNTNYYDLSADTFDTNIFYNFNNAITTTITAYPIFIKELGTNNFSITLDNNTTDLSLLKDPDFISQFDNLDSSNLKLNLIAELAEQYSGTDFYYLSTDSTGTNYVSGILFSANQIQQNLLNRRFPSIAQIENESLLKTEKQIGGFFIPSKIGIVNFYSFNIKYQTDNLKPNTVYTFPDPNKYGNISNLTQISFDSPFLFYEDVTFAKISNTNTFRYGDIYSDPLLKTFYGYQSVSENRGIDTEGIEKYTDPQDFFSGIDDDNWANADIFPIQTIGTYPIANRTQSLLTGNNNQTLIEYKTDIYGNEYGLFKETKQQVNPINLTATNNTGLYLNGGNFSANSYSTILSAPNFNYTNIDYYIISPPFSSSTFCNTIITFNLYIYTGLSFINESEYIPTIWGFHNFFNSSSISITKLNGGKFLVNGIDIITNLTPIYSDNTFFDVLNPSNQTQLISVSSNLSQNSSLYNERVNTYGNLYFRNINTSITIPASSSISNLFTGYDPTIIDEIYNNLKHFDIIYNNLILETKTYTLFIPFEYSNNLNMIIPQNNFAVYIKTNNNYENISNIWLNEDTNEILVSKTAIFSSLSTTNLKAIYPIIYKYVDNTLQQIYPLNQITDYSQVSSFSLSNTGYNINIVTIEPPLLSYNSNLNKYCITYIARDPSNQLYIICNYFKYSNIIYNMESILYKPTGFNHSENFSLSGFTNIIQFQSLMNYSSNNIYLTGGCLTFN